MVPSSDINFMLKYFYDHVVNCSYCRCVTLRYTTELMKTAVTKDYCNCTHEVLTLNQGFLNQRAVCQVMIKLLSLSSVIFPINPD